MKTLNNYFKEIHCINLKRRTDRWEECQEEFKKHNLKVNQYEAFDGNDLPKIAGLNPGQVGAIYSHRGIVEYAKKNKFDDILILEDDVEFDENINEKFSNIFSEIPEDWDMLLFGGNHVANNPWSNGKLFKISDHIYRVTHSLALHCYAVKSTIYDKIIDVLLRTDKTNDALVADIQKDINCYIIRPHLAWQRPSFSDLREMFVDMPFLYDDNAIFEGRFFGKEAIKRDDVYEKLDQHEKAIFDKQRKEQNY